MRVCLACAQIVGDFDSEAGQEKVRADALAALVTTGAKTVGACAGTLHA